jgi:hypothetical protein
MDSTFSAYSTAPIGAAAFDTLLFLEQLPSFCTASLMRWRDPGMI